MKSGLLDLHAMVELPRGNRPDGFARLPEIESFLKSVTEHQMLRMYRAFRLVGTAYVLAPGTPKPQVQILDATPAPRSARLWVARSPSSDFRTTEWRQENLRVADGRVIGEVARPDQGRLVFFGELEYEVDGLSYTLSTQMRMTQ